MREKLDYIYYRFYRFQISVGNASVAVSFGLMFLSYLMMLNFLSLISLAYALVGYSIPLDNSIVFGLFICVMFLILNFFLFIYNNRYKKIIKAHQNESKRAVRNGNIGVIIYMVFTFAIIGLGFYLMILRNRSL